MLNIFIRTRELTTKINSIKTFNKKNKKKDKILILNYKESIYINIDF